MSERINDVRLVPVFPFFRRRAVDNGVFRAVRNVLVAALFVTARFVISIPRVNALFVRDIAHVP